jgi:hypothetical protein
MTHEQKQPSDERLNAWIDGELAGAEADALLERMRTDAGLRDRVNQLKLVMDMVRHAYSDVEAPGRRQMSITVNPWWRFAAAASVALGVGLWAGWAVRDARLGATTAPPTSLALAESGVHMLGLSRDHIVLHVSSAHADQARMAALRASYPGLTLVACGQTARRLRDTGIAGRYLPGTTEASSALDAVMNRLQQGWAHMAI